MHYVRNVLHARPRGDRRLISARGADALDGTIQILEQAPETIHRSYSDAVFVHTPGWTELGRVLEGTGGAYGLYGPRGSGKSWAMMRAVRLADREGGMGLWFPCPSEYTEAAEFLSALADNLASTVEERFSRAGWWRAATRRGRVARRLVRQATALRERIKYTATLHQSAQAGLSATYHATGNLQVSRGKDLNERPTTVASLVFDIRRLAEMTVTATHWHVVIAIDELDKLGDPEQARKLLRDIKGIFEIPRVFFLVSVSEEAATTLQLGALQGAERNEFNSSFSTVIEMPPLAPGNIARIATARAWEVPSALAGLFCLLSGGNLRELIRLADLWRCEAEGDTGFLAPADRDWARRILRDEAATLWREVVRVCGRTADQVLPQAWRALPEADFGDEDEFDALSRSAIHQFWDLNQQDQAWREKMTDRWRRFLIRLFTVGQAISPSQRARDAVADTEAICDLRDLLIMAGHSTTVALLMLKARFGDDLSSPYSKPSGWTSVLPACHIRYRDVVLETGFGEVVVVPKSGHGETGHKMSSETGYAGARGMSLLDLSGLSLEDLARLDDSVVTGVFEDLFRRNRCGSEFGERLNNVTGL
ncbi:MAG TPA: P-loop NTPase fold protein [Trebonia sp.]|nr:P-loop NTPase fold protein [Trebonia sp.]